MLIVLSFLSKNIVKKEIKDDLIVAESKLGGLIKDKLSIQCIHSDATDQLMRGVRYQMNSLLEKEMSSDSTDHFKAMQLGLSHSLSRYKLKFSADKVDIMIIQAIGLLDDLDKEINMYGMRVREWYGWHFPEMSKIVNDNLLFSKCVMKMGMRKNAKSCDFSDILSDESMEANLKQAAETSMGTYLPLLSLLRYYTLPHSLVPILSYNCNYWYDEYTHTTAFVFSP